MHKPTMKIATYFLILLAAIATVVIGIKSMAYPITIAATALIVWAASPYAYLTLMAKLTSASAAILAVLFISLLTGTLGVWYIVDAMFIHLDAQGGLVFVFAPVIQWVLLALASVPIYFLNKVKNA